MYNFFNWLPLLKHTHTLNPSYRWWMWRVTASCWGGWSFSISATSRCGSGKKWVDSLSPVCSHLQSCWIINSTYLWLHSKLILYFFLMHSFVCKVNFPLDGSIMLLALKATLNRADSLAVCLQALSVDTDKKTVTFDDGSVQSYDQLLISTGCRYKTKTHSPSLCPSRIRHLKSL